MRLWKTKEKEQEAASTGGRLGSHSRLRAEVDRLSAQMEVVTQEREKSNERFQRFAEEIGGMRSMIVEGQQQSKSLEAAARKATELVGEVHPETVMAELRKEDAKVDALRAKIESGEAVSANLVNQLKDIRRTVELFKGVDSLLKLSNEVKEELRGIQRERAIIEKHSNGVEDIFVEVQKKFAKFEKLSKEVEELSGAFREISREFSKMKVRFGDFLSRKDFSELEKGITAKVLAIDRLAHEMGEEHRQFKRSLAESMATSKRLESFDKKFMVIDSRIAELKLIEKELTKLYRETEKTHAGGILKGVLRNLTKAKKPKKSGRMK